MREPPAQTSRFTFRRLQRADLPLVRSWRNLEHVSQWWGPPRDLEAEYLTSAEPVRYFIALLDTRPVGLIQHYRWADHPVEAQGVGADPDEDGIDYFLGDPELLGAGHGAAMLQSFLHRVVRAGQARGVRIDVAEANRRSWRCLEKLGFTRDRAGVFVAGEPGPHYVYALRLSGGDQP